MIHLENYYKIYYKSLQFLRINGDWPQLKKKKNKTKNKPKHQQQKNGYLYSSLLENDKIFAEC